jgi:sugar phosphate isomerase/epimerase
VKPRLSLSTNPFVNRFAEPARLVDAIVNGVGLGYVQLTHEFINPVWPASLQRKLTKQMSRACRSEGLRVTSMMTGPSGRLNHFGHPEPEAREASVAWFKRLAEISADLDCPTIGTQFAIFTLHDYADEERREALILETLACWREVAEHAKRLGLKFLFWEPMSVGRELGHTLAACQQLQDRIDAADLPIPLLPMIDVDHGDVSSPDPADIDPYAWVRRFAPQSPIIHIKQSSKNKGGHWPFTDPLYPRRPHRSRRCHQGHRRQRQPG